MKKVIYLECAGVLWLKIAQRLKKDQNWQPIAWVSGDVKEHDTESYFSGISTMETYRAVRGSQFNNIHFDLQPLDQNMLNKFAFAESMALQMMDRMDPTGINFPYNARRQHYLDLLQYWYSFLSYSRPDIVIFPLSPHLIYDFIVYELCKFLKIKTLMFDRPGLPQKLMVINEYEKGSLTLNKVYKDLLKSDEIIRLSDKTNSYFINSSSVGSQSIPINYQKKLKRLGLGNEKGGQKKLNVITFYFTELKRIFYVLLRKRKIIHENYLVAANKPVQEPQSTFSWLNYKYFALRKKRKLQKLYNKLTVADNKIDLKSEYIFFGLHYQPERATLPLGGWFSDQLLIVDLVSRALPKEYTLIIKEHPWQLQPLSKGELQRSDVFYKKIASYDNVVLVSESFNTSKLIHHSRAVVTITGSIGWQAICQKKPAFIFGKPWYKDCYGAYAIENYNECKRLVKMLADKKLEPPTEQTTKAFLGALERVCINGTLEPFHEYTDGLDFDEAIETMANILVDGEKNEA